MPPKGSLLGDMHQLFLFLHFYAISDKLDARSFGREEALEHSLHIVGGDAVEDLFPAIDAVDAELTLLLQIAEPIAVLLDLLLMVLDHVVVNLLEDIVTNALVGNLLNLAISHSLGILALVGTRVKQVKHGEQAGGSVHRSLGMRRIDGTLLLAHRRQASG